MAQDPGGLAAIKDTALSLFADDEKLTLPPYPYHLKAFLYGTANGIEPELEC